jgi:hypothetical protein
MVHSFRKSEIDTALWPCGFWGKTLGIAMTHSVEMPPCELLP